MKIQTRRSWARGVLLLLCAAGPVWGASSYADLRAAPGSPGQSTNLVAARIGGTFDFEATDALGMGDNNGIVLAAPNGWWVRRFAHSEADPIELDWFELAPDADVTALLTNLAVAYQPDFYVRAPTVPTSLTIGYVDLRGVTETFYMLESSTNVLFRQDPGSAHQRIVFDVSDYRQVKVGGPAHRLTFTGLHGGVLGGGTSIDGLFSFDQQTALGEFLEFRANVHDAHAFSLNHSGGHQGTALRTTLVTLSGEFLNGGLRMNSGTRELVFDDPLITDPYGTSLGWDGTADAHNNIKAQFEKTRGVWMQNCDRVRGAYRLQYAWSHWFGASDEYVGNGPADPLTITYLDQGYSGTGVPISHDGFTAQGGKWDFIGDHGPGKKYMRIIDGPHTYGNNLPYSFIFEATRESIWPYYNAYIDLELVNVSKPGRTSLLGAPGDYSRYHTVHGNMLPGAGLSIHEGDVVRDFTGSSITVLNVSYHNPGHTNFPGYGNTIRDSTILAGGAITLREGTTNNTITNVTFLGSTREVIHIDNDRDPSLPVTLAIHDVTVPPGSYIDADDRNMVTVTVDGVVVTLPHTLSAASDVLLWTAGGDGLNWNDPGNWNQGRVPATGDRIFFPDSPFTSHVDQSATLASLDLADSEDGLDCTLSGGAGVVLTLAGDLVRNGDGEDLDVDLRVDATSTWTINGGYPHFDVGGDLAGTGTVIFTGTIVDWEGNNSGFSGELVIRNPFNAVGRRSLGSGTVTLGESGGGGGWITWHSPTWAGEMNNTITVTDGTEERSLRFAYGGTTDYTIPADFVLEGDLAIRDVAGTDTFTRFTGLFSGSGGLLVDDAGQANRVELDGSNTYSGSTVIESGTLRVSGSLAHAHAQVQGTGAVLDGTGTLAFHAGETIVVSAGAVCDARTLQFDVTALPLTGGSITLVDYSGGTFMAPSPLGNLLTTGSVIAGYQLVDTGSSVMLERIRRATTYILR